MSQNKMKRRIAVGIWEDTDSNIHFVEPELLAVVGLPNTDENRRILRNTIRELIRKEHPEATLIERSKSAGDSIEGSLSA